VQSHKREIGDKPPDPAEVARQLPPPSPTHVCFFFPESTRHLCQIARSLVYTLSIMRLSIGISLLYFSLLVTSFPHSIPRDVYTRSLTVPDGLDSTLRIRCTNSKQAGCEDEISLPVRPNTQAAETNAQSTRPQAGSSKPKSQSTYPKYEYINGQPIYHIQIDPPVDLEPGANSPQKATPSTLLFSKPFDPKANTYVSTDSTGKGTSRRRDTGEGNKGFHLTTRSNNKPSKPGIERNVYSDAGSSSHLSQVNSETGSDIVSRCVGCTIMRRMKRGVRAT